MKKGIFTSIWYEGGVINTPAELNEETGEVTTTSVDVSDMGELVSEYFTDEDENEYEICPDCHEYITKTVMVDGIGKTLEEKRVCSNFECAKENSY